MVRAYRPAGRLARQAQPHDLGDERVAVHAGGCPEPREAAHRRHTGDGVDLVDQDAAVGLDEEVAAREAAGVDGGEGGSGERLSLGLLLVADGRGDDELHHALGVLGLVVVELVDGQDLAGHRGARGLVAEHRALDLPARRGRLHDDLAVVGCGQAERRSQLGAVVGLGHAHAGTEIGRLDEDRILQARLDGGHGVLTEGGAVAQHHVVHLREPAGGEHSLHDLLVHAHRAGKHAGAGVGQPGHLEQALDGAVLGVRAVHDGKGELQRPEGSVGQAEPGTRRVGDQMNGLGGRGVQPLRKRRIEIERK